MKRMANIFLSASVPYLVEGKDPWYFENADTIAIRDAVLGVANAVLPEHCLIWGGHPSITKLIRYSYQAMTGCDDDNELRKLSKDHVVLYQSAWYSDIMPDENAAFGQVIITGKKTTKETSLAYMRQRMLTDSDICLGVFIGGMDGVDKHEYPLFRELCPKALAIPFPTTGAAALKIYDSNKDYLNQVLEGKFVDRLKKDYAFIDLTKDLIKFACV